MHSQSLPAATPAQHDGGSWKFSITFKQPGAEFKELVNTKATFQPEINKNSIKILQVRLVGATVIKAPVLVWSLPWRPNPSLT